VKALKSNRRDAENAKVRHLDSRNKRSSALSAVVRKNQEEHRRGAENAENTILDNDFL
jgi:hypothetical protein